LVAEATRSHDASELVGRLQAAGIAAGVVASALDLHADPGLAGWGFFQWLEHPARPPAPYEGHALRLGATPGKLRWAAPALGEHFAAAAPSAHARLLSPARGHDSSLEGVARVQKLVLDRAALAVLRAQERAVVRDFPLGGARAADLVLARFEPFAPGARAE